MDDTSRVPSASESIAKALEAQVARAGFIVENGADFPEPPPISAELIAQTLRFGRKLLLAGPSHSGKTSLLLALALAVSQGKAWLGLSTEKSHVLYVNLEIDRVSFIHRLHQVARSYGLTAADRRFHFVCHRGGTPDVNVFMEFLRQKIIELKLAGVEIRLVIIDPVYKLIGLGGPDETSNRRASELISGCGVLSDLGNVAMVFAADVHISHPAYQITHEIQNGIGQLARDVDALLMLWPLHGHPRGYRLKGHMRDFPGFTPRSLLFDFPLFVESPELDRLPVIGSAVEESAGVAEIAVTDVWKVWESFKTKEPVPLEQYAAAMNLTPFEARQKILQAGPHPRYPNLRLRLTVGSKVKAEDDS